MLPIGHTFPCGDWYMARIFHSWDITVRASRTDRSVLARWSGPAHLGCSLGYGPAVMQALIFTYSKSHCKLSSTKCGPKASLGSNIGSGPYSKCNTYVPNSLYRALQTVGLLPSPSHSNVHVRWVWKEMQGPQDPVPSGRPVMVRLFTAQPWNPGCHIQQRFNLLLIFHSEIFLKGAVDDNLGEWYSIANHLWST